MSDWCDLKPDKWGPSGRRGGVDIKPNGNTLRSKKSIRWRVECGMGGIWRAGGRLLVGCSVGFYVVEAKPALGVLSKRE